MSIAKVEPLTTARALRGPFDYRLPPGMDGVRVGTVLRVPFGPRRLLGVVVEIAERSALPPDRLAEPIEALEAGVPPELVDLGRWIAREYCSTPARGLELVLPPGTATARGQLAARTEAFASLTPSGRAALRGEEGRIGPLQRRALTELAARKGGEATAAAELTAVGVGTEALRRLERRRFVRLEWRETARRPRSGAVGAVQEGPVVLNPAQRAARDRIVAGVDASGGRREWLLHGVTGSGKTEVYLGAAEAALQRGRGVIVLVPEIGLTPQTVARFQARFGDQVAVLHSRLAAGERRDEWTRLRRGDARICVGPRSAIFAPIAGLGLVVIDEEHDPSYKQEGDPRYDARDVARRRAADAGAVLLCGSATPRPETWSELARIELPERVDGRPLPPVEVLDMRGETSHLHPATRAALTELRDAREKAIVLVNRRGWAPFICCRSCGYAWTCPHCDVSLVLHRSDSARAPRARTSLGELRARSDGRLRCHHCNHAEPIPDHCGACGSVAVARAGAGSEQAEALLADLVAPLPVFRLDSDAAAGAGAHLAVLRAFERADGGVLVGTQMVAKGHDFPDVTLAIVLDADASLRFPDFRAEERTFAQVAQLAGRSGRGERGGRVLVQTLAPQTAAIRHAAAHDTAGFVRAELARRRTLAYPPFSHLIGIELASADEGRLRAAADELRLALDETLPASAAALGPAPRFRLRGRHRRRLLVKASDRRPAVAAVRAAVEAAAAGRRLRDVALAVDVDPQ